MIMFLKAAAIVIVTVILSAAVGKKEKDIAVVLIAVACCGIAGLAMQSLSDVIAFLWKLCDFTEYQTTVTNALDAKVDDSEFTEYQTTVSNTLDTKVDDSDFTEYQTTVSNALDSKVDDSDFTEYQTTVSNALDTKATVEALNTLEGKVDIDIANLSTHMTEAAAKIAEVDGRLSALDAFVEAHESILESDIVSLFTPKAE